ncbi:MAG: ABC transporter transmembrane domain-containing protein, partial [Promethearchaeota archaeon]
MVYFGLDAEEYDRSYSDIELLRKIGRYLKDHLKEMIIVVIFVTLASVANGLTPFFTSKLIGELELNRGSALLIEILVFILILNSLGWGFNFINQFFTAKVVNHVVFSIRSDVNKNVMIQDLSFFDKYPTGKIVSRINSDTYNFGEMAKMVMQTASSFLSMFIILIPMLIKNFKLTLIILIMTPFIFAFTLSFRKIARKKTLLGQRSLASVNSFIQESMSGIQIAKTFRQEHKLYKQFNEVNKQCYKVNLLRALYMNLVFPGLNFIQGITLSVLIYFGGNLLQSSTAATTAL